MPVITHFVGTIDAPGAFRQTIFGKRSHIFGWWQRDQLIRPDGLPHLRSGMRDGDRCSQLSGWVMEPQVSSWIMCYTTKLTQDILGGYSSVPVKIGDPADEFGAIIVEPEL